LQNKGLVYHALQNWTLYATEVGDLRLLNSYRYKIDLRTIEADGERLMELVKRKQQWHALDFLNGE
jgi:hypothetical protein